ncbi:hypothetical protein [Nitrospirillum iridis]|uniref:Uncharacterized protein n=1 Tax=Nitrospirillum iridis TaxID=765888 RepID=A0A7X0B0K7_9PROT|nr:hypothetical protein [Nitrospirillum iridis]MBB6253142.1 hypothetical protein [Nitrospirillum iridis]
MSSGTRPDQVTEEILRYFLRNPMAADSLEGIARWRLLNETVYRKVDETRVALAWLVDQAFLTETTMTGIDPVYRFNAEKRQAAETLLRTAKPRGEAPCL